LALHVPDGWAAGAADAGRVLRRGRLLAGARGLRLGGLLAPRRVRRTVEVRPAQPVRRRGPGPGRRGREASGGRVAPTGTRDESVGGCLTSLARGQVAGDPGRAGAVRVVVRQGASHGLRLSERGFLSHLEDRKPLEVTVSQVNRGNR